MSWPDPVPACSREEWARMTDGAPWPAPGSSPPQGSLPWIQRGADGELEYEIVYDQVTYGNTEEIDEAAASNEQVS